MERTGMSAGEVVSQLRAGVEEKTGLTISAGIAPNKMLAKVSHDHRSKLTVDLLRQEQAKWAIRDGVREIRHHALHA
jgi:nucleotidyltransferase/DNA polymerase involved in DNA repair